MAVDYSMRDSRLTVDKLGAKLYDKVSAVIAELIVIAYYAGATVVARDPTVRFLATRAGGPVSDESFEIEVADDGSGMSPLQMQDFFHVVGAERCSHDRRGGHSPRLERKVMVGKGVGKLASYGI